LPFDSDFYAAAERRIRRFELAIAILGALITWQIAGPGSAAAFLVGAAISAVNFLWLKQAVDVLAEHSTGASPQPRPRRARGVAFKFLARYALIALAAYVILKHTAWNMKALFAGLFLFVAAILAEICFEIVAALTAKPHGT
jgi:hypothetical protein